MRHPNIGYVYALRSILASYGLEYDAGDYSYQVSHLDPLRSSAGS